VLPHDRCNFAAADDVHDQMAPTLPWSVLWVEESQKVYSDALVQVFAVQRFLPFLEGPSWKWAEQMVASAGNLRVLYRLHEHLARS
jgi:hypothetical protein